MAVASCRYCCYTGRAFHRGSGLVRGRSKRAGARLAALRSDCRCHRSTWLARGKAFESSVDGDEPVFHIVGEVELFKQEGF